MFLLQPRTLSPDGGAVPWPAATDGNPQPLFTQHDRAAAYAQTISLDDSIQIDEITGLELLRWMMGLHERGVTQLVIDPIDPTAPLLDAQIVSVSGELVRLSEQMQLRLEANELDSEPMRRAAQAVADAMAMVDSALSESERSASRRAV